MSVKKGDTIYRKSDGQPVQVLSTRALRGEVTRLYLGHPCHNRSVDLYKGRLSEYADWSLTQTPELAQRWADTLRERAEAQAEQDREREQRKANRIAHRDTYNTPENPSEPEQVRDNEVRVTYNTVREGDDGTPIVGTRSLEVTIYHTPGLEMTEQGEWSRERVACVNWSALGSVTPAVARAYAKAILMAADIAEQMPNEPDPFAEARP